MALKFSGAYRQCKPSTGSGSSSSSRKGQRPYPDIDMASEGFQYYPHLRTGSSSSTPAWDFTSVNRENLGMGSDSRFKGMMSSGDRTPGGLESVFAQSFDVVLVDEDEPKEWMAQVEPGVHITFVSLPQGGNDLKRIRFSREMFNKWQAQRWWGENYDRIMELYNVQRFNRQALPTPPRSEDERDSSYSRIGSARESPVTPPLSKERTPRHFYRPPSNKGYFPSDPLEHGGQHCGAGPSAYGYGAGFKGETSSVDASRTTTSSRDEASVSISNASDQETEWVEQDEPGVYITIRQLPDGTRELRRVRFSRERFGEVHAKMWWEENRERIQAQYL
ncbi:PREDICTED: protein BREVIS RADIX-like isoform X2 [Nelumbo nucifera]|nr:PREDICTED: protein BREVIS RADIX-like isoform X2 [Nelumbo nucifera]XP_010278828.1 PREDICTED: protein BREVIS RADIX-like isoform X2 [Nelumbo nucifera]